MPEVWHPAKAQNGCISKDEKNKRKKKQNRFRLMKRSIKNWQQLSITFYNLNSTIKLGKCE